MFKHPASPTRIVVTGASSGLGAALAVGYATPGTTLGLIGRNETRLMTVAEQCRRAGAEVDAAMLDVADSQQLGSWLTTFAQAPVDLVIANAGTSGGPRPGSRVEGLESATRQVQTNLLGVMNTIEPLLPGLIALRRGRIAIVASVAGYRGLPYSPAYSASKAGARMYGESLRALLKPAGITVTVICPGFFSSPMTDRFKGRTPFLLSLERTAAIVKRGIDSGRSRVSFPLPLALALRLADLAPAFVGDPIMRANRFHIEAP
jgi:short-subunit dehydrogenase